jgi:Predicted NTPase (NACHT family)
MAELLPGDSQIGVATDQGFVMLYLYRMSVKITKERGQVKKVPDFLQIPIISLLPKRKPLTVIFGSAGSGKSTSLKRLAYLFATRGLKFESSEKPTIPVLLRAPDLASNLSRSLVEYCDAACKRITGSLTSSFSSEDLNAGRVCVLVDALDELPVEHDRISVLSLIGQFHQKYPNCSVVVTSRDYNSVKSLAALQDYETYTLSPIDHKQAHQILKTLQKGKNLPAEKSQELIRRLDEVHGMELNPLLVTVFAATSDYCRQDIPANITELFKKFTEMMLGRWDATKGFKYQYHAPLKDFILQKIAFEMHRDKLTSIDMDRFERILTTELENRGYNADTVQLRDEILNRSGLFIVVGHVIQFRHLMMQEFFAGRGISSTDYLNAVIADPWWRRPIVFYFGEHPGDSGALNNAITALDGRTVEENYNSALTLGLALQACYLVEIKDKIDIYRWTVDAISAAKDSFFEGELGRRFPLRNFVFYYLLGRDSVALSVLENKTNEILDKWKRAAIRNEDREVRLFWVICGLIECGAITDVEDLVAEFKPVDLRFLLGIHLGCFLTQHVRVAPKAQRDAAKRICNVLASEIEHLRAKLLEEVRTDLLEMRKGVINEIELPPAASEPEEV